jgi:hypothetical protein
MIKLLLGLDRTPEPHDASDALAVAICHLHSLSPVARAVGPAKTGPRGVTGAGPLGSTATALQPGRPRSWRQYKPA